MGGSGSSNADYQSIDQPDLHTMPYDRVLIPSVIYIYAIAFVYGVMSY